MLILMLWQLLLMLLLVWLVNTSDQIQDKSPSRFSDQVVAAILTSNAELAEPRVGKGPVDADGGEYVYFGNAHNNLQMVMSPEDAWSYLGSIFDQLQTRLTKLECEWQTCSSEEFESAWDNEVDQEENTVDLIVALCKQKGGMTAVDSTRQLMFLLYHNFDYVDNYFQFTANRIQKEQRIAQLLVDVTTLRQNSDINCFLGGFRTCAIIERIEKLLGMKEMEQCVGNVCTRWKMLENPVVLIPKLSTSTQIELTELFEQM